MSSISINGPGGRDGVLDLGGRERAHRDAARVELAREIAAQHDRLRALRASVLRQLGDDRQIVPRWPSGPKPVPALVDEGEWWAKMLGRERRVA